MAKKPSTQLHLSYQNHLGMNLHLSYQNHLGMHLASATQTLNIVGFFGYFFPAGFEPVTLTSWSALTTKFLTQCPTPWGQSITLYINHH